MNSSSPSSTPQRYLQRICSSSVIRIGIALVLVALVATLACVDTTVAFRACFGTLLALFGCAQIYMAVKLIRNRRNPLLELSQPIPMSIFAIAGAIATLTCFMFALPAYSVSCAIRQPIIFTSISIMGSILVYVVSDTLHDYDYMVFHLQSNPFVTFCLLSIIGPRHGVLAPYFLPRFHLHQHQPILHIKIKCNWLE